jgi:hypothetical protein
VGVLWCSRGSSETCDIRRKISKERVTPKIFDSFFWKIRTLRIFVENFLIQKFCVFLPRSAHIDMPGPGHSRARSWQGPCNHAAATNLNTFDTYSKSTRSKPDGRTDGLSPFFWTPFCSLFFFFAMGCSLMGVGKVFLRHVAPTRYGDQTLAAGEHLAPGFSQWRLALAA